MAGIYRSKEARRYAYTGRIEWTNNLLEEIKPTGEIVGVEVGFWKGDFGKSMLDLNPRLHWVAVDPYEPYGKKKRKQPDWDAIHDKVMRKLSVHPNRFTFIRERSHVGVKKVPEGVDFVFIDGNHDYEPVKADLFLYEQKIRPGGIMSGHDYHSRWVKQAVDEHIEQFNREVHFERDFDACTIFWWRMP